MAARAMGIGVVWGFEGEYRSLADGSGWYCDSGCQRVARRYQHEFQRVFSACEVVQTEMCPSPTLRISVDLREETCDTPPDHKEKTRARILAAAGKVFRRLGYHAAGVDQGDGGGRADGRAGFTRTSIPSRRSWPRRSNIRRRRSPTGCSRGPGSCPGRNGSKRFWSDISARSTADRLKDGCPLAALVSEVSRADERGQGKFRGDRCASLWTSWRRTPRGLAVPTRSERAMAAVALCVGGLGLARSVRRRRLCREAHESCRKMAAQLLCGGAEPLQGKRARERMARRESNAGRPDEFKSGGRLVDKAERRVVVTGLGMVTPVGLDVESTWESLREGRAGSARSACSTPARSRRGSPPS